MPGALPLAPRDLLGVADAVAPAGHHGGGPVSLHHHLFARRGPNNPDAVGAPPCEHECRCGVKVAHAPYTSACGGGVCVGFEVLRLHLDLELERENRRKKFATRGPEGV